MTPALALPVYLTRAQVREVDRISIERYHIPGIVLMENASRGVADEVVHEWSKRWPKMPTMRILILCGGGNNGGDGLAAARHLTNRNFSVMIGLCADPAKYRGDALINWKIIQAMRIPCIDATPDAIRAFDCDLIVDAIFGTGLTETPREPFAQIVAAIADTKCPVVAIDLPSGLDCDTGFPHGPTLRAVRTVTFVAQKAGFANPASKQYTGEITVTDIGCPAALVDEVRSSSS